MSSRKKTHPEPPDVGPVPEVLGQWIDAIVGSWNLTRKEREVCELMLKGLSSKEMASALGNTEKTLKHHIASVYAKAHVETRGQFFAEILRR